MQIYSGRKPIVVGGQQQFHLPCTSSKKNTRELIDGVAVLLRSCYGHKKPKVTSSNFLALPVLLFFYVA